MIELGSKVVSVTSVVVSDVSEDSVSVGAGLLQAARLKSIEPARTALTIFFFIIASLKKDYLINIAIISSQSYK